MGHERQAQIEKLRKDAAECALIRDLAPDKAKRELFDRLAKQLTNLADQVTVTMLEQSKPTETSPRLVAYSLRRERLKPSK